MKKIIELDYRSDPAGVGILTVEAKQAAAKALGSPLIVTLTSDGRVVLPITRDVLGLMDDALWEYATYMSANNETATTDEREEYESVAKQADALRAVIVTLERLFADQNGPGEYEIDLSVADDVN